MEQTHKINKIEIRNLRMEDYDQLAQSFTRVYADKDVFWTRAQIKKLITIFPEGQIVTVADDKIVGCALSIIVDYDMVKGDHTYAKVTGNETFNTHNPKGNILYGIEVFIHPEYRGLRLARRMYDYRKELCEKLNLKAIMFGGRIPNYYKYADTMRPKEYIEKVRLREIYDPVLTFHAIICPMMRSRVIALRFFSGITSITSRLQIRMSTRKPRCVSVWYNGRCVLTRHLMMCSNK